MTDPIAKQYESFISAFHKTLIELFKEENVKWMESDRRFRVRPMWIPGAGVGYIPDMSSCVRMTLTVMNKFNESYKYRITQSVIGGTPLIGFYDDSNSKNGTDYICYVSVHHDFFF
jgi:hypothetical protein